jgi:fucose permease
MVIGFEGIALSASTGVLKVCIYLFGVGGGAVNGSTNALISDLSEKDKGANLSLLGAFFGIGALGMPLISGIFKDRFGFETILSAVAILTFAAGIGFLIIRYPPPKQEQGFPISQGIKLMKDNLLLIIAFFLFFQSGFEGIINNWTTTYLINEKSLQPGNALFGLSSFVGGMTIMRLLSGSLLRNVPVRKILISSFVMIFLGLTLLRTSSSFGICITGLVLLGAGLASGFPVMLGFVGEMYSEISGTAFSVVMFIALTGNTLINYAMGIVVQKFGTNHLITFAFAETLIMIVLCLIILKKDKQINS